MDIWDYIEKDKTYIIAEISANHNGHMRDAIELVRIAKEAGADCVKTQTYTENTLTINSDKDYFKIKNGLWKGETLYSLYSHAKTPWEWQNIIKEECEKQKIDFLSTPFDITAVDYLNELKVDAFKISSFEIVDIPLISYAAKKNKTMIISCGLATKEEIEEAVDSCIKQNNNKIILMKCCSQYPANIRNLNLKTIVDMQQSFNLPIGFSDHTKGTISAIVACSIGAKVIEKHICLDHNTKSPDNAFSLDKQEFKEYVRAIRLCDDAKGKTFYGTSEEEKKSLVFRKSIFAVNDIEIGTRFTEENVRIIRPGYGLAPKYYNVLLQNKSKRKISKGEPILLEDIM